MSLTRPILTAVFALAFGAATTAVAQQPATAPLKLASGTWTGTVTPPNGQVTDVTYDIATRNDTISMTINAGQFGTFPAQNIKLEADKLTFTFTPGPQVSCSLTRKPDGSYAGDCTDDGGGSAQVVMVPPKQPASGAN